MSEWARVSTMRASTRRSGSIFDVAQFFVINLVIIFIYMCCFPTADARKSMPPLIDDDQHVRMNKPECHFGGKLFELGSSWFADLGPPFGVMYCLKCECLPVTRKKRVVGVAKCHNLMGQCPKVDCDDPVQVPGKCCKVCPGKQDVDLAQDVPVVPTQEEEEKNMKNFGALLTTPTSQFLKRDEIKTAYLTDNPLNIVATGRFTFRKKNLYYSFYVSDQRMRPRAIQFIDETGHIFEENLLMTASNIHSVYQNVTGKLCGVWHRVPRDYRKMLRDQQIFVVLLWDKSKHYPEFALAGKIFKTPALVTEQFTSLLESNGTKNMGGTAIVATSSGDTSSIHLTLVLNGLFYTENTTDVPLNIRLESLEKHQTILNDTVIVRKPNYDYNFIEYSSVVSAQDIRLLTRGKLNLIVQSRKHPNVRIQGPIKTRATCEIYQTVLAPTSTESKTRTSGVAWAFIDRNGSLVYNISTDDLNVDENPSIALVDDSGKRKAELEDLTKSLSFDNGFAAGVLDGLGPRVVEPLYSNKLAINIFTGNKQNLVRGKLIGRPVADSRDAPAPILLKRSDPNSPSHLVGMAWMSIDNECTVHYEVTLNDYNAQQGLELYLEDMPIEAPNAPTNTRLLEEFHGEYAEGFIIGLDWRELRKLEQHVCYLKVKTKEDGQVLLLKGKLRPVPVPKHCIPVKFVKIKSMFGDHTDNEVPSIDAKCYHSGRFYDEGEQWQNGEEKCSMCACVYGRAKCDKLECPPIICKEEEIMRKDECCPICASPKNKIALSDNGTSVPRGCRLGDQFHSAGSSWYPYLPPNGFDKCAICTCDPITLDITCPRQQCPPLGCPRNVAFKPDKGSCCLKCPEERKSLETSTKSLFKLHNTDLLGDQESHRPKTAEDVLEHGGCKVLNKLYENGDHWHPVLASHGEQKCIQCRCKDGKTTCDRKRCTLADCKNQRDATTSRSNGIRDSSSSASNQCCALKCRRSTRNSKREQRGHKKALRS